MIPLSMNEWREKHEKSISNSNISMFKLFNREVNGEFPSSETRIFMSNDDIWLFHIHIKLQH